MKILFVCSGNSETGISPIIQNQANSLMKYSADITIEYYCIKGKGIKGYLKSIKPLENKIKKHHYDVIHAHYSLSAFCASLSGAKPLVVSLMGSDVKANVIYKLIIKCFAFFFAWKEIIVKSEDMKSVLGMKRALAIPNGVDIEFFYPMEQAMCQKQLGWDVQKKHILFPANPQRYEKNYVLAEQAVRLLKNTQIEIHYFENVPHTQTSLWYNAADVVLLTSLWEGSPNAIKEAMVCCCPIVATDVGDVKWLFGNEPGHFMCRFDAKDVADKISLALDFATKHGRTQGRQRLIELGLDSETTAKKIIRLYQKILENK